MSMIVKILTYPQKFSIKNEGDPHLEIIVNPSTKIEGHKGFKIFIKPEETNNFNTISI